MRVLSSGKSPLLFLQISLAERIISDGFAIQLRLSGTRRAISIVSRVEGWVSQLAVVRVWAIAGCCRMVVVVAVIRSGVWVRAIRMIVVGLILRWNGTFLILLFLFISLRSSRWLDWHRRRLVLTKHGVSSLFLIKKFLGDLLLVVAHLNVDALLGLDIDHTLNCGPQVFGDLIHFGVQLFGFETCLHIL